MNQLGSLYIQRLDSLPSLLPRIPSLLAGLLLGLVVTLSAGANGDDTVIGHGPETAVAIFAGGCFWCMEPPYDELSGVISTTSGYTGGTIRNPTYQQVSSGITGHTEAVKVVYDPAEVSYGTLLEVFWRNIDPIAVDRQFCDVGDQYRTGIYYLNDEQKEQAMASKRKLEASGRFQEPIATEIEPAGVFYLAEHYHQDYYKKNPIRYKMYRYGCGRDQRLEALWGSDS